MRVMKPYLVWLMSVLLMVSCFFNNMIPVSAVEISPDADDVIHMFICYGQSWSVGYDTTAITTQPRYDNLMLDIGIKNNPLNDLFAVATHFVDAVEQTGKSTSTGTYKQNVGETPVSAQMNMVRQLIDSEKNVIVIDSTYTMLGNAPGMGSKTLVQLQKGTDYYARLIAQVQQAQDIAAAMDKHLVVEAFSWVQGSLGGTGDYAEALERLRQDVDADVKIITGQTETVKCITWQSFIYNKSLRAKQVYNQYVGASETYPHIICAGATYHLNNVRAGNLHFNSESQDWLGAYFGVAYKRTIIDGEKFEPLKPIGANIDGNALYVKFHVPYGSLVFDGDYFDGAANEVKNEGFALFAANGEEKVISDVSIVSSDTVKILCAEEVADTDRLTYGNTCDDAYQWVNSNRGHLRDTQGDVLQYKSGNLDDAHSMLPLHNWCVLFDKEIRTLDHFEMVPVLLGDVDSNGKVNNRDLGLLQQYLNEMAVTIDGAACDLNGDGKVNNRDLGLLQQYLTDWDVTFG